MPIKHAFDLLTQPITSVPDVVGVFGNDATLRSWVLHAISAEGDLTQLDGATAKWSDLRDDLSTASLFDFGSKRTIVIREADEFLTKHRSEVEDYVAKPGSATRFVLELETLASNTRVYKSIDKSQWLVACGNAIDTKRGVTTATRRKFVSQFIGPRHQCKVSKEAAELLFELLGDDLGMIDTEIAKLALYRDIGGMIDEELVRDVVAGWQAKTVWQITDAIAAGNAAEAIRQLDKLFEGGERAIALLPQIAWSLRRLGLATAVVLHREREGRAWKVEDALAAAGIHRPSEIEQSAKQLKGIGRARARQLLPWLLDADLRLKGTHSAEGRDRFLLEQLVLKLAKA
jgi:DNA polymerase III subunit delta